MSSSRSTPAPEASPARTATPTPGLLRGLGPSTAVAMAARSLPLSRRMAAVGRSCAAGSSEPTAASMRGRENGPPAPSMRDSTRLASRHRSPDGQTGAPADRSAAGLGSARGGRRATVVVRGSRSRWVESTAEALRMGSTARTISLRTVEPSDAVAPNRCISIPPMERCAHRHASSKPSHRQACGEPNGQSTLAEPSRRQLGSRKPVRPRRAVPLCAVWKASDRLVAKWTSVRTKVASASRRYEVKRPVAPSAWTEATHVASRTCRATATVSAPVLLAAPVVPLVSARIGSRTMYEQLMRERVMARMVTCPDSGSCTSTRFGEPAGGKRWASGSPIASFPAKTSSSAPYMHSGGAGPHAGGPTRKHPSGLGGTAAAAAAASAARAPSAPASGGSSVTPPTPAHPSGSLGAGGCAGVGGGMGGAGGGGGSVGGGGDGGRTNVSLASR
eukprot:scaffold17497_cov96-Isochrysis_galbana.AAC.3